MRPSVSHRRRNCDARPSSTRGPVLPHSACVQSLPPWQRASSQPLWQPQPHPASYSSTRNLNARAVPSVGAMSTSGSSLPLGDLFLAAALPVIKVALLCGVGATVARLGILTLDGRRAVSALIFNVFSPCLFFSSLGAGEGVAEAVRLWPLTVNMVLSNAIGLLLGAALIKLARVPLELHKHMLVAVAVGNTGNLPLVLVASLGSNPALPFLMGSAAEGLKFVILGSFSATLIQFPLVNTLLRQAVPPPVELVQASAGSNTKHGASLGTASAANGAATEAEATTGGAAAAEGAAAAGEEAGHVQLTLLGDGQGSASDAISLRAYPAAAAPKVREGHPTSETTSETTSLLHQPSSQAWHRPHAEELWAGQGRGWWERQVQRLQGSGLWRQLARSWVYWEPVVSGVVSPPIISMLLALVIASVPVLKACFFSPTGALRLVGESTAMFGQCCIPSLMLVLGANLSKGPGVAKLPARVIASVILCRLVLLPLCGTPLVALPFKAGWFGAIHPMAVVVMLVTNATPTAIIVHAIATMYRNREDDLAALLFWEYLASIVSLPLLTALFLHIAAPG
ncbi:auxin efflux carrier [Haematococcus lacustris]